MTIQQIRYCLGVADCGSFNKASEKLYISQPSLTSSVHDLERELDFPVFKRSSRGVVVTEKGNEFLCDARALYENYLQLLEKYTSENKRTFSVATLYYEFARKAFIDVVKEFSAEQYTFSFREMRAIDIIEDVSGGKSNLGLLYLNERNRDEISKALSSHDLEFTHLTDCGAFIYIHKSHPLAYNDIITLEDLLPYHFVTFDTDDVKSFFTDEAIEKYKLNQPIKVADRSTELNLLKKLNGYTFLSNVFSSEQKSEDSDGFITVPLKKSDCVQGDVFDLGYITNKKNKLDVPSSHYISRMKKILNLE